MRYFLNSTLILLILSCMGCGRPAPGKEERRLQDLLKRKEYFALQKELGLHADEINKGEKLYLTTFIDNAFNRNAASIARFADLFGQYGSSLSDTMKARLLLLEEDNYFKTFQYARAAAADSELIGHYRQVLDSATYADIKNTSLITHALAGISPQTTTITANASLPWKKDKVGLMEIAVRKGDSSWSCIFDTRANISSISASYAKKLGVKMLDVSYREGSGATGNAFQSSLGIADSLWLGPVLLRQVVFQVMPDEVLYIAPIDFRMNVIIGYPVIASLREIHVFRNGTMTIPLHTTGSTLNNLAMDGLDPVVLGRIGNDTLCFQFDTGATTSDLYALYFRKYKAAILRRGIADTIKMGGAGGIVQEPIYRLDSLTLGIGSQTATLRKVSVRINRIPHAEEKYYGNLGQDIIAQYNEMILNFTDMYLDFK